MGQRMQAVIQIEDADGKRTNTAYHLQWGIGKILPLFIMHATANLVYPGGRNIFQAARNCKTNTAIPMMDEDEGEGFEAELQRHDFSNINEAAEWFSGQDNNNGGAVILVRLNELGKTESTEIRYLRGTADCREGQRPFAEFLKYDDYIRIPINSHYCDTEFNRIYKDFMNYFLESNQ